MSTAYSRLNLGDGPSTAWHFWRRWVGANALAEAIGLGGSALAAYLVLTRLEDGAGVVWSAAAVVLISTLCEGTAVGVAQWSVLRAPLPRLRLRAWWSATALGAFVAWTLGMVPSTLMSVGEASSGAAPMAEPPAFVIYALAALMGLALGPILAAPQWWVLRRHLDRAWRWFPANALAWAAGMVVIFMGVGIAADSGLTAAWIVPMVAAALAGAGALVGAIHGFFLLRMLEGA